MLLSRLPWFKLTLATPAAADLQSARVKTVCAVLFAGSDISVWHKIRVVPTIFFYDEGAVVSCGVCTHNTWVSCGQRFSAQGRHAMLSLAQPGKLK